MAENQNIEWKESWRDEYLKWICGFANAQGGKIYIGTNDDGTVIGVKDSKKLLEDIPNKTRDILGIIVDVNLLFSDEKEYIEIDIHPSSYPVSYKGEYHYRTGSTKQLLHGAALTEFLLSKTGYKWDAVPIDNVSVADLDKESFEIFRREALKSGRMSDKDLAMSDEQLLDSLGLMENGRLKRAALLLFHRNPEKWVTGAYIKIGYFGEGSDLRYQDELHGSLLLQADRIIDLIYLKYMKASIAYDGITRIETYPFPKAAIREAVFNAIIHSNYAALVPIQIRIHEKEFYISNDCVFPVGWTIETLMSRHRSQPYNPHIASVFFRAGYVETWGRGIERICEACSEHGIANPEYSLHLEDIMVKFEAQAQPSAPVQTNAPKECAKNGGECANAPKECANSTVELSEFEHLLISIIQNEPHISVKDLAARLELPYRTTQRRVAEARERGLLSREGKFGRWLVMVAR